MKIGAGGLQSLIVYDAMPQRSPAEAQARTNQTMAMEMGLAGAAVNRKELLKAVQKLNGTDKAFNQLYEFSMVEDGEEVYVVVIDKNSGEVKRRLSPEQFWATQKNPRSFSGVVLDSKR